MNRRDPTNDRPSFALTLLGPMELRFGGISVTLPRSRKCRALLGYLAVTARAHRREQLCGLFWDVADDPRGALRWSLSRLRAALPRDADLVVADRAGVSLRRERLHVDAVALASLHDQDLSALTTERLEDVAAAYRGDLLEGLELPDFLEFTAWCTAQREHVRSAYCRVLHALLDRFAGAPARALPFARLLAQQDGFDVAAHETLLRLLLTLGHRDEAERRYIHASRQFREVAAPQAASLERAWIALRSGTPRHVVTHGALHAATATVAPVLPDGGSVPFVGRHDVLERLRRWLAVTPEAGAPNSLLLTGEPGAGKSRLFERLRSLADDAGYAVLGARAYDLERGRPFGPWLDALGVQPAVLSEVAANGGSDRLVAEIAARVRASGAGRRGVVLALDDVHWMDRDSLDVLRRLVRSEAAGPLLVALSARGGELPDNPAVVATLDLLRRTRRWSEIALGPLDEAELRALVGDDGTLDLGQLIVASAGNALYALELARHARTGAVGSPPSIVELIRERVGRLSEAARDVLRWAAVLGYSFDLTDLEALSELTQAEQVDSLEELERHGLLRIDAARMRHRYTFGHDVVREAVYGELSYPRRRLMHRKVAGLLADRVSDPEVAHEVARHASAAGEAMLGVAACVTAGRASLRACANADAEALARRGLHHVASLDERHRIAATLDLLHVLYSARTPDRDEAADRVRALAERALDLGMTGEARMGFQMLSFLRWESSSMASAHENILQAERVSRSASPDERSEALAHAARCLVLLERNLGQAEAFALEARGVAARSGRSSAAVAFALAMIAGHRGEFDAARAAFVEAQTLARASGERLVEFSALEHRLMLCLDRGLADEAGELAPKLVELGTRVRPGAEVAIARALAALHGAREGDFAALEGPIAELRAADAKYELAYVLSRAATYAVERNLDTAERFAAETREVAEAIGRVSERAVASAVLVAIARRRGDSSAAAQELARAPVANEGDLSAHARGWLQAVRSA